MQTLRGIIVGIKNAFNKGAKDYDLARKQLIPCFENFYGTALDLINFEKKNIKVLDLGAGTGLFSYFVAEKIPSADYTLIDLSDQMLNEARNRFSKLKIKINYLNQNYANDRIEGKFDLIISALSIHHLTEEEKEKLFSKLYSILNVNGLFINADQVLGQTEFIENSYKNNWLKQVRKNGVSETSLNDALERMKEDKMSTLQKQLQWLNNNNFKDVNCWYQNQSFVVYSGKKE